MASRATEMFHELSQTRDKLNSLTGIDRTLGLPDAVTLAINAALYEIDMACDTLCRDGHVHQG